MLKEHNPYQEALFGATKFSHLTDEEFEGRLARNLRHKLTLPLIYVSLCEVFSVILYY